MLHFKFIKHTKFCLDEIAIIGFIQVTSITHHNKSYGKEHIKTTKFLENHETMEKYIKTTKFLRKPMVSKSKNSTAFNGRHLIR